MKEKRRVIERWLSHNQAEAEFRQASAEFLNKGDELSVARLSVATRVLYQTHYRRSGEIDPDKIQIIPIDPLIAKNQ